MKTHELLNILNHFPPQSEWDGGDVVETPDGKLYSLQKCAEHMTPGKSHISGGEIQPAPKPPAATGHGKK